MYTKSTYMYLLAPIDGVRDYLLQFIRTQLVDLQKLPSTIYIKPVQ